MVKLEIIGRVLRIVVGAKSGSSFTMECNGTQFLVTAKHLFEPLSFPDKAVIKILMGNSYNSFDAEIRYPKSPTIDIAVMKLNPYQTLTAFFNNENTTADMCMGQDVFFLGFPYDYDNFLQKSPFGNNPIPFVKKACMSSIIKSGEDVLLLLDGHNNPGFSGGPVCFSSSGKETMTIAGVISGYRHYRQPVVDENDTALPLYWKENTGIIYAYSIKHAVDIASNWN